MRSVYQIIQEEGKWLLTKDVYTVRQVTEAVVIFSSVTKEEVECMLDECQVLEQAAEWERFNNQQTEFELYGDNAYDGE